MIDITPYQQKLILLKEWLDKKMDGTLPAMVEFNIEAVMNYSMEDILRIYRQTGMVYYSRPVMTTKLSILTFEDYCANKLSKLCHNT